MNWCFLNAELGEEKAHCSLKRCWDWRSLCTASHHIRQSCSLSQSDCGPSCKAALTYFHIESLIFVEFIAKTINITNVSLWDAEWKQLLSSLTIKGNTDPLTLELWFIWFWIDLHSNNTLFFLLGLRPSNGTWTQYLVTLCYHDDLLSPPWAWFSRNRLHNSCTSFCSPPQHFPEISSSLNFSVGPGEQPPN